MKPSDLWTPKGRRAVGKLSLDLLKITGKVAVAGTTSLVGALASAAATIDFSDTDNKTEDNSRMLSYGRSSDGIGGIDTRRD